MRITSLRIERFGVWENLNLPKISRGLNVFFGPNEAGKTTLMQFIRTCLYGGGDEDRARYIQMALDGRRRRERRGARSADSDDPRRTTFAASLASASDSNAPEDVRRFLEAGKKGRKEDEPVDSKGAARSGARSWIGGVATVQSDFGAHRLERRYIRRDSNYRAGLERAGGFVATDGLANWSGRFYALPGRKIAESLVITGPDGARVGDYFAKSLTCNLDESTYNGIFAIGLDELQRLGMLNETEAAQMLYRLSVGVDRGAFVQVFQQIVAERNDMLDVKGGPSILDNLLKERDKSRASASESAVNMREYARVVEERRAVQDAVKSLQERLDKAGRQKRTRELALQVAPVWDERDAARAELEAMGDVADVPRSVIADCDALVAEARETAGKVKELKLRYRAKRDERDAVQIDPALDELAPRVAILEEDLPRLTEIDEKVSKLRDELTTLNARLNEEEQRVRSARNGKLILTQSALDAINASLAASERERVAKSGGDPNDAAASKAPNHLAELGAAFKEVEDFKIPARRIRRARRRLQERRQELDQIRERLAGLVAKLEEGLTSHGQKNLTEAIDRTGALLSGLRRRVEIEKRVVEMATYRKELERQNRALVENQAIVGAPLYALGAGVVVGGLLFGLALFSSRVDIVAGLFGLLAMIGCIFYKTTVEKRNRMKLEDNQRRLGLLAKQMEQARAETQALDEKFPAPVGSPNATFESRLQKAKADLAFFEALAPVETQWRETTKQTRAKEDAVKRAEEALKKSHKRWKVWLRNACLPTTLKPKDVRDLFARVEVADDLRAQVAALLAEIEYLGRERQGIVDRFDSAVALLPRVEFEDRSPFYVTPKMRELLDEHAAALKERADLLFEMNAVKKQCKRLITTWRRQSRETRKFLNGFGVHSRDELVAAVERRELYLARVAKIDEIQRRLDAALGGFCPEDEIAALLVDLEIRNDLPTVISNLTSRIEALDVELKGKLELSGRLGQQADALAANKDFVRARFDSFAYDLRLAKMAELWQSRAVAGQMMEDIRRAYEKERQPETLREASRYLKRLTNGMYVNIWTPLGEDMLFVDASNGETLEVSALSRGTRELLFIAIRLALVVSFEKHGVQMPLIWDDVLVNFDYKRAATAAKLLYDFAKAGRQVFLFTCHEHICRLFLRLGTPVCVLPTSNDPKRRRFRVLTPLRKRLAAGEAELTINVAKPVELGPNFCETPSAPESKKEFAVDGTDFDALRFPLDAFEGAAVQSKVGYAANPITPRGATRDAFRYLFGDRPNVVVEAEDPAAFGLRMSDPNEMRVRRSFDTIGVYSDVDATSSDVAVGGINPFYSSRDFSTAAPLVSEIAPLPTSGTIADLSANVDLARRDGATEYAESTRNVDFEGQSARFRALSEISPTFTSQTGAKGSFDVSASPIAIRDDFDDEEIEAEIDRQPSVVDGVDYVPVDESSFENADSLDYDEWTKVFSDQDRAESSEPTGAFLDYFDSPEVAEVELPSRLDDADDADDADEIEEGDETEAFDESENDEEYETEEFDDEDADSEEGEWDE